MRIGTILAFLAVVVLTTSFSLAQNTALESFNYPPTTLVGVGTAAHGFSGPWEASANGTEGLVSVCNSRFDYANLAYEVKHDTVHLQWVKSGAWSDANRYKRPMATAIPNTAGNTAWLSYLVDFQDSLPVGNTYFMVKLFSGTTELLAAGHGGGGNTPQPGPAAADGRATPVMISPPPRSPAIPHGLSFASTCPVALLRTAEPLCGLIRIPPSSPTRQRRL